MVDGGIASVALAGRGMSDAAMEARRRRGERVGKTLGRKSRKSREGEQGRGP